MQKTFDEIFQEMIKLRKDTKATIVDSITPEQMDAIQRRQHVENTFFFNSIHGRMVSKDNETVR